MRRVIRRVWRWIVARWECATRQCSYYRHYLAYGSKELEHVGYHWAERHCIEAQQRLTDWMERHPTGKIPVALERIAVAWEKRVRA